MGITAGTQGCRSVACVAAGKHSDNDADCPAVGIPDEDFHGLLVQDRSSSSRQEVQTSQLENRGKDTFVDMVPDARHSVEEALDALEMYPEVSVLEEQSPPPPAESAKEEKLFASEPEKILELERKSSSKASEDPSKPRIAEDAGAVKSQRSKDDGKAVSSKGVLPRVATKAKAPIAKAVPDTPDKSKAVPEQSDKSKDRKDKKERRDSTENAAPKKKSYLQQVKERKAKLERDKEKNRQLVDDIMAGKYKKEGGGQPGGNMRIHMPTPADRQNTRIMILEQFRAQYRKIGRSSQDCPSAPQTSAATSMYSSAETQALQIVNGHQYMPRPENVNLPTDFRAPLKKPMSLKELKGYGCESKRMFTSVYGDIFDVSDRPDKYATDGPYAWMSGHDITWGFVSGRDVPETVDKCYDLWKVAPETFRDAKLKLIYAWVAFYEWEYGKSVGKLEEFVNEAALKGPPMEESQDCCIM